MRLQAGEARRRGGRCGVPGGRRGVERLRSALDHVPPAEYKEAFWQSRKQTPQSARPDQDRTPRNSGQPNCTDHGLSGFVHDSRTDSTSRPLPAVEGADSQLVGGVLNVCRYVWGVVPR